MAETTGTAGGTSLVNNDLVLIHQSQKYDIVAGYWELNKVVSGGGTTNLTFKYPLCNTYSSGSQILKLKQYSSLTVNNAQTWTVPAWNGSKGGILAFFCKGNVSIEGTITATGKGYAGGASVNGEGQNAYSGNSFCAPGIQSTSANGSSGGGGGKVAGSDGAAGGGGGYGTEGVAGQGAGSSNGGQKGATWGDVALTSFILGGSGGGGAQNGNPALGCGGNAGGAIIIIGKNITFTGSVVTNGNDGGQGDGAGAGSGGGGTGGAILLKGQTIVLGTNLATALGAAGGTTGTDGGAGGVGRIHVDYLTSLTGSTTPTLDSTQDSILTDIAELPTGINQVNFGGFIEF